MAAAANHASYITSIDELPDGMSIDRMCNVSIENHSVRLLVLLLLLQASMTRRHPLLI
jgi:hypothetical protein